MIPDMDPTADDDYHLEPELKKGDWSNLLAVLTRSIPWSVGPEHWEFWHESLLIMLHENSEFGLTLEDLDEMLLLWEDSCLWGGVREIDDGNGWHHRQRFPDH